MDKIQITKCFGIYRIKNLINDKIYVGSTTKSFSIRWRQWRGDLKRNKANKHLSNAWNKYGKDVFEFSILEVVIDKEKVLEREQYWIDTLKPEYNNRPNASSNSGWKMPEEAIKKRSNKVRGRRKNPRPNCKCGKPVKEHYTKTGRFHSYYLTCNSPECKKHFTPCSEQTKKKIGEAQKRIGNRPSFKGHKHSEETKKILSEKSKIISLERRYTEEAKKKMSEAMKGNTYSLGRVLSEEHKRKISNSLKERYRELQ